MGTRSFQKSGGGNTGRDRNLIQFEFTTNGASDPTVSTILGAADAVKSITHIATGKYLVTLSAKDFYQRIWPGADLLESSTGDGEWAAAGNVSNEASTTSAPITFNIYTFNSSSAKADITSKRCIVTITCLNAAPSKSTQNGLDG